MSGGARLDGLEHYPKRTFRNRFTLMQSTGTLELSLPVEKRGGRPRSQDETMRITGEPDRKAWQAVRTAYGRAPFFEEMEEELEALFKEWSWIARGMEPGHHAVGGNVVGYIRAF